MREVETHADEVGIGSVAILIAFARALRDETDFPTIEPEVRHGRWIPVTNGRGGHECDQCHNYAPSYQTGEEHLSDYCPHCGAMMKQEQPIAYNQAHTGAITAEQFEAIWNDNDDGGDDNG